MAALEGEVKDLKRKIRGHQVKACELDKEVSESESLKAQKEREQQHLQDQLLLRQQQVRKLTWAFLSPSLGGEIYWLAVLRPRDSKSDAKGLSWIQLYNYEVRQMEIPVVKFKFNSESQTE